MGEHVLSDLFKSLEGHLLLGTVDDGRGNQRVEGHRLHLSLGFVEHVRQFEGFAVDDLVRNTVLLGNELVERDGLAKLDCHLAQFASSVAENLLQDTENRLAW